MNEKSFVLLSLKDDTTKKITQALNNDTSRKILDYLANHESATETELSKTLNIPMSTVHYNVKMLCEGKLLESDEYNYSSKGKEVIHYKLANKYIIIAPKEDKTFMDKLKKFVPGLVGVGLVSLAIGLTQNFSKITNIFSPSPKLMSAMTERSMDVASDTMLFAVESYHDVAPVADSLNTSGALWFLFGGMFVLLLMVAWDFAKDKNMKKTNNKKTKKK